MKSDFSSAQRLLQNYT